MIAELWVVYGYYSYLYLIHFAGRYSPYHGYNYSYLMLTNIISSNYMSDCFAKMIPILGYIELYIYIWVVTRVLYAYFCLECTLIQSLPFDIARSRRLKNKRKSCTNRRRWSSHHARSVYAIHRIHHVRIMDTARLKKRADSLGNKVQWLRTPLI